MSDLSREEMKATVDAASARMETKLARFEGKLDQVLQGLNDMREDNRSVKTNSYVIAVGLAALILAVGFGVPAVFGVGLQTRDIVRSEVGSIISQPKAPAGVP